MTLITCTLNRKWKKKIEILPTRTYWIIKAATRQFCGFSILTKLLVSSAISAGLYRLPLMASTPNYKLVSRYGVWAHRTSPADGDHLSKYTDDDILPDCLSMWLISLMALIAIRSGIEDRERQKEILRIEFCATNWNDRIGFSLFVLIVNWNFPLQTNLTKFSRFIRYEIRVLRGHDRPEIILCCVCSLAF